MGAEGDESSEDEEEIRLWLDNRDWNGMSTLVCREDLEECTNLNTLQEVFDQERILTLMDTSDSPMSTILEEDSEGVPTAPLTPASPPPEGETNTLEEDSEGVPTAPLSPASPPPGGEIPPQDNGSPCSPGSVKEKVKNPEWGYQRLEYEEQGEKRVLTRQLESAISKVSKFYLLHA